MRKTISLVGLGLFLAGTACGQTNSFEMPTFGTRLPATAFKLTSRVPSSRLAKLPKHLPVFRFSGRPTHFATNALQELINQTLFSETNITDLLRCRSNQAPQETSIRMATVQARDRFYVDAHHGAISYITHETGVNLRKDAPEYDSVPSFESLQAQLLHYAGLFGVSTNEMEQRNDGSLYLRRTDDKTVARGGTVKFISRRSVAASRTLAGYPILASTDRVELALGVKGRLMQFDLKWPSIVPVRTNQVCKFGQIFKNIQAGLAVADIQNKYPDDGISEITLIDMRIFYYIPELRDNRQVSMNVDIIPVASLHALFRSKSGKTENGGLFTALLHQ